MIKIVFLSSSEIAQNCLKKLINFSDIDMLCAICSPDKPKGRGKKLSPCCIKTCALDNNIKVFETSSIKNDKELIKKLKSFEPDFFVTFSFGQILSQEVLDIPKIATINLHSSLLPKYRGANPIQRAILNGDLKTGITTMITQLELDAGDICLCEEIEIEPNMGTKELSEIMSQKAPFLIYKTIKELYYKELKPKKQPDDCICFAHKCKKEDMILSKNDTVSNFVNKVRAFNNCGFASFLYKNKIIKVLKAKKIDCQNDENLNGKVKKISKNGIEICLCDGCVLVEKVKPEGKKEMSAFDFSNGLRLKEFDVLLEN